MQDPINHLRVPATTDSDSAGWNKGVSVVCGYYSLVAYLDTPSIQIYENYVCRVSENIQPYHICIYARNLPTRHAIDANQSSAYIWLALYKWQKTSEPPWYRYNQVRSTRKTRSDCLGLNEIPHSHRPQPEPNSVLNPTVQCRLCARNGRSKSQRSERRYHGAGECGMADNARWWR